MHLHQLVVERASYSLCMQFGTSHSRPMQEFAVQSMHCIWGVVEEDGESKHIAYLSNCQRTSRIGRSDCAQYGHNAVVIHTQVSGNCKPQRWTL